MLGPLLFMVYINDLQNNTSLKVLNFADNTLLYTRFKKDNHKTNTAYLNSELDDISKGLKENRLKLNTFKTRCMIFYSIKIDIWKNIILHIQLDNSFIKKGK